MSFNFLIASERSGSNLITKLIGGHSSYCAPFPPHLLRAFYDKIEAYNNNKVIDTWSFLVSDFLELFNAKIGTWNTILSFEELYRIEEKTLAGLVKYLYKKEAKAEHKTKVFIKEVKTYKMYNFLQDNFSEAKFVYLVRDPRDMALSWKKSPVHRGDLVRASKVWKEDQAQSIALLNKYPDKILLIRYEDLIANKEHTLTKVCDFLMIPFEDSMLDFYKSKLAKENSKQTDNWKNLNQGILSKNFKKYINELTKDEISYIEYICANEMSYFNYTLDYPKVADKDFQKIETEMLGIERYHKKEYELVPDTEKLKRIKWMSVFNKIKSL